MDKSYGLGDQPHAGLTSATVLSVSVAGPGDNCLFSVLPTEPHRRDGHRQYTPWDVQCLWGGPGGPGGPGRAGAGEPGRAIQWSGLARAERVGRV
jgi:hypothetical protein